MNFCSNCGIKIIKNTKFCSNCGIEFGSDKRNLLKNIKIISEVEDTLKNMKVPSKVEETLNNFNNVDYKNMKNKNIDRLKTIPKKYIAIFLGLILAIFLVSKYTALFDSQEEKAFMNTYNKAVELTSKGEFGMSNVELDRISRGQTFKGVNIQRDKEINIKLLGISMMMRSEYVESIDVANTLEELMTEFDKLFKNDDSKILSASEIFREDVNEYIEYLKLYSKAEKYLEQKDKDNVEKIVNKLKKFEFKTEKAKTLAFWTYSLVKFENFIATEEGNSKIVESSSDENNSKVVESSTENPQSLVEIEPWQENLTEDKEKWIPKLEEIGWKVEKTNGRWYAFDQDGMKHAVVYENEGEIRLVNATRNVFVNY